MGGAARDLLHILLHNVADKLLSNLMIRAIFVVRAASAFPSHLTGTRRKFHPDNAEPVTLGNGRPEHDQNGRV
jgi:hypothetical protein